MPVLRRYLLEVLLGAAAFFAVVAIAFGTADRAERWSYNRTEYSPTGNSSNSSTVTGAVPNEVSGRAALGFALASGMSLIAAAVISRPVEHR